MTLFVFIAGGIKTCIEMYLDPRFIAMIVGLYLGYRFFRYRVCTASDTFGVTYNRRTGMVDYCDIKGNRLLMPITDCEAVQRLEHYTGGSCYVGTYIRNKKNGWMSTLCNGSTMDGIITWNYIVEFMDISKPLADIAEVEDLRHLDPVTKAYDEQHPRERHYWRKFDRKQTMKMEDEAKARGRVMMREINRRMNTTFYPAPDMIDEPGIK